MLDLETVATSFQRFAENECAGSSDLYYALSKHITRDRELLALAAHTKNAQPIPNLFLGSVNFIRQREGEQSLAGYYDLIQMVDESLYPAFKTFTLKHSTEVIDLLSYRLVQTNEVNRSAYLYPMLCEIHQLARKKPLILIEIGAAAGLNLCCDRYRYEAGRLVYGDSDSNLTLYSEFRSTYPYRHIHEPLTITRRVAIDINRIDMHSDVDRRWMRALIWPEHRKRQVRFDAALRLTQRENIEFVEGNGVELLGDLLPDEITDSAVCVFHTHVANQMPRKDRQKLVETIDYLSTRYDLYHLYNNIDSPLLQLIHFEGDTRKHIDIAETEGHGQWVDWTGEPLH